MDYTTMRGLFFAPPGEERPPPPTSAQRGPARRLRDEIEPLACLSIWSIDAAVTRLRSRGLVEGDALSAEGVGFRTVLETQTDAMQQSIVDAIGPDLDALTKQLDGWSDALVAAGAAPPDPAKRAAG